MIKLSVVITNYNKVKWLPRLLKTLQKQKNDDVEYIIIDDASTDNSQFLLNNLDKDTFKVIYHTKNTGIGLTRQEGFNISKGKYLVYIDGDDNVAENYITTLLSYTNQNYDILEFAYQFYPNGKIQTEREYTFI